MKTNGASFYHAGDLNNWKWDGAGELVNGIMDVNYKNQIKNLQRKTSTWHLCRLIQNLGCISHLAWNIFWRTRMQSMCFQCICGRIIPGYSLYQKTEQSGDGGPDRADRP